MPLNVAARGSPGFQPTNFVHATRNPGKRTQQRTSTIRRLAKLDLPIRWRTGGQGEVPDGIVAYIQTHRATALDVHEPARGLRQDGRLKSRRACHRAGSGCVSYSAAVPRTSKPIKTQKQRGANQRAGARRVRDLRGRRPARQGRARQTPHRGRGRVRVERPHRGGAHEQGRRVRDVRHEQGPLPRDDARA